ncbi:CRAL/TRIO domain-containing protein, partial [Conidiobolus coronatus NRRL 28638]
CLLRYLRATRWKLADAEKRLKSTLEWRRVYKPHMLRSSQFIEAGQKGHMITQGFDKFGRPIFIMRPGCQNSTDEKLKVQFMVYTLETAIKRCPEGTEQLCIIIDWRGSSTTNGFNLNAAYESTNILQNHYPGRMGITYSLDASWILSTLLKLMLPLIDPLTQKKIKILNLKDQPSLPIEDQMISVIDKDVLYEEYGGASKLNYDPNSYFEELAK